MNSLVKTVQMMMIRTQNNNLNYLRGMTYKSAISLEQLYPGSNLKLTTPTKPLNEEGKFSGYIPMDQIQVTFSRSSGPGGQNVNKVNTKVDLRFHLLSANWLNEDVKKKLYEKLRNKVTKEGFLVFKSDVTRYQQLNLADCLDKVRAAIRVAEYTEPEQTPETAERLRKRYEKAVAERLIIKKQRTQVKEGRRYPIDL